MLVQFFEEIYVNTFLIILTSIGVFYYWFKRPCRNFPPGPRGIPILGSIPFLGTTPEVKFIEMGKLYGNIFSVRMGRREYIILNDADAINEGFVKNSSTCSNRNRSAVFDKVCKHHGIISINYDKRFKSQKKFALRTLRGFGVGKRSMEERVTEEITILNNIIQAQNNKPFDLMGALTKAVSNNICSVVFGKRFEYEDPVFIELLGIVSQAFSDPSTAEALKVTNLAPVLQYIPPFKGFLDRLISDMRRLDELVINIIDDHKKSFDQQNLRDFVDAFISEMNKAEDSSFTNAQLIQFIGELFVVGTETTASTISWGILCFLHHPQTQQKVYREIVEVVGINNSASYSQRDEMPYTSAFIQEVFRFKTLSTLGLLHASSCDTTLAGFNIPKDTPIISNIWGAHNNPNVWDQPEKFLPERHLNQKGEFVKSDQVIPFGVGPRQCMGEQLGRMEIFIFIVSLVQKFKLEPDSTKSDLPELDKGCTGLSFTPLPFTVSAKER